MQGSTIAAIATPPGAGGIAVVRLSGAESYQVAARVFCPANAAKKVEEDNVPAVVRQQLVDPLHDIAERTAQDVKEVHTFVHSAPAVARDALFFYRRTPCPQCSASQEAILELIRQSREVHPFRHRRRR